MWKQWLNFVLGILVIIVAYMSASVSMTIVILGVLIALIALWAALEKKA